jgi:DNA-binding MarR family transcriptional regulator
MIDPSEAHLLPKGRDHRRWSPYGAIHRAYHGLGRRLSAELVDLRLSGSEALAIRLIGRPEAVSPGTLVDVLALAPSTVTSLLRRLEDRGFVERVRSADDRRFAILRLTPDGRYALERVAHAVDEVEADLRGSVSGAELDGVSAVADAIDGLIGPVQELETR